MYEFKTTKLRQFQDRIRIPLEALRMTHNAVDSIKAQTTTSNQPSWPSAS